MPLRQGTFKLVPTTLAPAGPPKPPMTSKAAKKAYKQATKQPRVLTAEQRRIEKEELAAAKRERERERAAVRAREKRDAKMEKERAEKEERRKRGVPEQSRWVRPSQPVITGFARKRRRGDDSAESGEGSEEDGVSDGQPPMKIRAVEEPGDADDETDEFGDFPELSQSDLPAVLDRTGTVAESGRAKDLVNGLAVEAQPNIRTTINPSGGSDGPGLLKDEREYEQGIRPLLQSEALDGDLREETTSKTHSSDIEGLSYTNTRDRTPLAEISRNMPPPPRPVPPAVLARQKLSSIRIATEMEAPLAPPSTLRFLENHLEDFFPSPSQEIRELLEDIEDYDLPSNTQIEVEMTKPKPDLKWEARTSDVVNLMDAGTQSNVQVTLDLFYSQDLEISSQDLLEMDIRAETTTTDIQRPSETTPTAAEVVRPVKPRFFIEKDEDLLKAALEESIKQALEDARRDIKVSRKQALPWNAFVGSDDADSEPGSDYAGLFDGAVDDFAIKDYESALIDYFDMVDNDNYEHDE